MTTRTTPSRATTALKPAARLWMVVLLCPPLLAAINPTWGLWAAILAIVLSALPPRRETAPVSLIDALLWVAALFTLVSPHWTPLPEPPALSPSINGAACLIYAYSVRRTIYSRPQFEFGTNLFIYFGAGYSIYVVLARESVESASFSMLNRSQVEFANANYTGAVLAFTLAVTLWRLKYGRRSTVRRIGFLSVAIVQMYAIVLTGSRASTTGVAMALVALIAFSMSSRLTYRGTAVLLIGAFPLGLIHQASEWFRRLSEPLATVGTFRRDQGAIADVSGRDLVWVETREAFLQSPLLGWGPDRYREVQDSTHYMAHSWGLEFLASVGILGTTVLAATYVLAFRGGPKPSRSLHRGHAWIVVAFLSIVPNLVLSTHQWTLWSWVAVALMSRTHLFEDADASLNEDTSRSESMASV